MELLSRLLTAIMFVLDKAELHGAGDFPGRRELSTPQLAAG